MRGNEKKVCKFCKIEFIGGAGWYEGICSLCFNKERNGYKESDIRR